jgi:sodium-coupled monocarboxylate transporter 8/12
MADGQHGERTHGQSHDSSRKVPYVLPRLCGKAIYVLSLIDALIISAYLIGMIVVGLASRGRQRNANEYFTAKGLMSGSLGTLLVGLSLALFSGVSFLYYPAVVYNGGIVLFVGVTFICMPLALVGLRWFLPRYLDRGVTQPYETIEHRFGKPTRTVASIMYVFMRIGWMAALIYAPTLAVMAAARLSPQWFWPCILITGLVSTLYTVFGGIRGVIVTDAVQFIIITVGIAASFACIWLKLPVSLGEAIETLREANRLNFLPLSFDPTVGLTIWTVAIGVTVANLFNYVGDPMSLQRYLATGDTRAAMHTFVINFFGVIFVLALLSGVGLSMFVFYHFLPDSNLPADADKIYPHFIATQLPNGVSGLMLAALLAATMSSMTSGINALAATITLDILPQVSRTLSPAEQLRFGRICSCVIGIASTLLAGVVHRLGSLFDLTQIILGVFAGPLLIVVLLSVTTWRVAPIGIIIGLIGGCAAGWVVAFSPFASLWTAPVAAGITLFLALSFHWLASRVK